MNREAFEYFCKTQYILMSLCIRIYNDDKLSEIKNYYGNNNPSILNNIQFCLPTVEFPDNMTISIIDEGIFLLGYIKVEETGNVIILGPVRMNEITTSDVKEIMRKYGIPAILNENITSFLSSTPVILLENFLMLLSSFNLIVNDKIITIQEIMQQNNTTIEPIESNDKYIKTFDIETPRPSGAYEEALIYYIKNGLVDEIKKLNRDNFIGKVGQLGPNQLRSLKNALISQNSICLRAAVAGGLDTETAYSLGERYAQRIEDAKSLKDLGHLSPMIRYDYCQRVKNLSMPKTDNIYILKVINYIQNNLYSKITVAELAELAGIEPEYLSLLSKQHLKCTMTQYIAQRKISEAKKLLRFTDNSLSDIANLLCYSSQSHFQRQFKKIRGITPEQYRKKYVKK